MEYQLCELINMLEGLLMKPIHALAVVAFIAGVSAIMFSRGLSELVLTGASPYTYLGLSIVIISIIPIITHMKIPDPKFITVILIGSGLMFYGIMYG